MADPDLSTQGALRPQKFSTVRKGYDPAEVDGYQEKVAKWAAALRMENQSLRDQLRALRSRTDPTSDPIVGDPYGALAGRWTDVLRYAEEHANKIRLEADQEAARRLTETTELVERMRQEAADEMEAGRKEATLQAERTLQVAARRKERVELELAEARENYRAEIASLSEEWKPGRTQIITELYALQEGLQDISKRVSEQLAFLLDRADGTDANYGEEDAEGSDEQVGEEQSAQPSQAGAENPTPPVLDLKSQSFGSQEAGTA